jgi:RHS repeat-associated protein
LTNASGVVTNRYIYDAFGHTIAQIGSTGNVYLFAGEARDSNTGLDYLRARYLNVGTGRFISRDTFEGLPSRPISLHRYVYADANPLVKIDPAGEFSVSIADFGAISGILTVLATVPRPILAANAVKPILYLDLNGLSLARISLADGRLPSDAAVADWVLRFVREDFKGTGIKVVRGKNSREREIRYVAGTKEGRPDLFGRNEGRPIGGRTSTIYLGRLGTLKGKFEDNIDLARAIANISAHEAGHSFFLWHTACRPLDMMAPGSCLSRFVQTSPGNKTLTDYLIKDWMFTSDELQDLRRNASTQPFTRFGD